MNTDLAFIMLGGLACITIVVHSISTAWLKVRTHGAERRNPPASLPDLEERLTQIERAIDAISLETERNGEAQRYLIKLLGERAPDQMPR